MRISKTLYVADREDWRAWLEKHHATETEVWLIYYKKHSGRPRIAYDAAVEEALCFGWIDSIVKKIDEEKFAQRFTPRRDSTNWSELNKRRMRRLIQEGRMTDAGLAKIDLATLGEETTPSPTARERPVPEVLQQALMASPKARENFNRLAPSYRRHFIAWIMDAKKEQTRARRVREAITLLEQNKKLGMK
jgi:uncharacterized protein YdeI (YjbR/CyaY-like superfamily)